MFDIHCHILPRVDDGSGSPEISLAMAACAAHDGIKAVVATPHLEVPDREAAELFSSRLSELRRAAEEREIPLKILPGAELLGSTDLADAPIERFTLNGTKYLLVEFFPDDFPERVIYVLESVRERGFVPVVAHPERYDFVADDPGICEEFKDLGCLIQLTTQSVVGDFGRTCARVSASLIEWGLADVVASDAHSDRWRRPVLSEACAYVGARYGEELAARLFIKNPLAVINGENI
ncbi:MAG: hypothetical protein MJ096_02445 [Clostridia bacterium]|nr:hypothetical protein [Clostridia bacterium]